MGRDIQAIKISGEDRRRYREKVQCSLDVFARMLRERMFEVSPSRVGVEIELNLVDSGGMPSMRNAACWMRSRIRPGRLSLGSSIWRSMCRPGGWKGVLWRIWSGRSGPA